MTPHEPGRLGLPSTIVDCENAIATMASEMNMPAEPVTRRGFRPTLSTRKIAMKVTATFTTEVIVEMRNESLSLNPTACQSVVE